MLPEKFSEKALWSLGRVDLENKMLSSLPPFQAESILVFIYESIIMVVYVFLLSVDQTFFSVH